MGEAATHGSRRAWTAVALLWLCGFFNYADRQAVFAVFPLLKSEFKLDDTAKGWVGSAFMIVYALASPLTGFLVDRYSRRWLVAGGLALWSIVCAATGMARSYGQLLWFRAAEGLGESCYFPASMSLLADHHGSKTRSRAMSVHQTSVYLGTAVGAVLAGSLAARFGWRSPFWVLGVLGFAYALALPKLLREPTRTRTPSSSVSRPVAQPWYRPAATVLANSSALALLAAFFCANFVATAFLAWLPDFVYRKFLANIAGAAFVAGVPWPCANLLGALLGGWLADRSVRTRPRGGRARVQAFGLLAGTPWVFMVAMTDSLGGLVVALVGAGLCKGLYDANIFAALYDVVEPEVRGVAAGLMNTIGWSGGLLAPVIIGAVSDRAGLSQSLAGLYAFYIVGGLCAGLSAWLSGKATISTDRSGEAPAGL
jgi:MFS family permease